MSYETKYLKYKMKYLALKNQIAGTNKITIGNFSIPTDGNMCEVTTAAACKPAEICQWNAKKINARKCMTQIL
jgi:hypothetical protein